MYGRWCCGGIFNFSVVSRCWVYVQENPLPNGVNAQRFVRKPVHGCSCHFCHGKHFFSKSCWTTCLCSMSSVTCVRYVLFQQESEKERERERQTDRQTDRQTKTERDLGTFNWILMSCQQNKVVSGREGEDLKTKHNTFISMCQITKATFFLLFLFFCCNPLSHRCYSR